jgi:methylated-DNA-[protein]-cysteine S-methyltransferase
MGQEYWLAELSSTPIGPIGLAASADGLARISLFGLAGLVKAGWQGSQLGADGPDELGPGAISAAAVLFSALGQLHEYLGGSRRRFDLPLDLSGIPPSRLDMLSLCQAIPYGQVRTYAHLAHLAGHPGAPILVGAAMAANPLPLVIPCHRVIGSDRRLHGFAAPGGISTKAWLLKMEGHQFDGQKLV